MADRLVTWKMRLGDCNIYRSIDGRGACITLPEDEDWPEYITVTVDSRDTLNEQSDGDGDE